MPNDGVLEAHANADYVIGINAGSKSPGVQAIMWTYSEAANQLWTLN
jgi:hypothetical protein